MGDGSALITTAVGSVSSEGVAGGVTVVLWLATIPESDPATIRLLARAKKTAEPEKAAATSAAAATAYAIRMNRRCDVAPDCSGECWWLDCSIHVEHITDMWPRIVKIE